MYITILYLERSLIYDRCLGIVVESLTDTYTILFSVWVEPGVSCYSGDGLVTRINACLTDFWETPGGLTITKWSFEWIRRSKSRIYMVNTEVEMILIFVIWQVASTGVGMYGCRIVGSTNCILVYLHRLEVCSKRRSWDNYASHHRNSSLYSR